MTGREAALHHGRPRLLDLFCGAGGASKGYHDVGFEVVGVDHSPQPNYPFEFIQADAVDFLRRLLDDQDQGSEVGLHSMSGVSSRAGLPENAHGHRPALSQSLASFDAIHASPPCQRYSDLAKRNGNAEAHPDLIGPVRDLLDESGLPYVIENVEGAPLNDAIRLCGSLFGLGVNGYRLRRHRLFESNVTLVSPGCWCHHNVLPVIDVSGGGPTRAPRLDGKGGRTYKGTASEAREAMGIDWMTKAELNEAVPPVYTRIIGGQVLAAVQHDLRVAA